MTAAVLVVIVAVMAVRAAPPCVSAFDGTLFLSFPRVNVTVEAGSFALFEASLIGPLENMEVESILLGNRLLAVSVANGTSLKNMVNFNFTSPLMSFSGNFSFVVTNASIEALFGANGTQLIQTDCRSNAGISDLAFHSKGNLPRMLMDLLERVIARLLDEKLTSSATCNVVAVQPSTNLVQCIQLANEGQISAG